MKLSPRRVVFGVVVLAFSVLLASSSLACEPAKPPTPEPAECAYPTLAELEADYTAEAVKACKGKTRATCAAMPEIEAKYAAKREAWIRCHR